MKNIQEEPKQETLEDAAERTYQKGLQDDIDLSFYDGVRLGAKWQAERMYSEEDLREAFRQGQDNMDYSDIYGLDSKLTEQEWFEQFKTK